MGAEESWSRARQQAVEILKHSGDQKGSGCVGTDLVPQPSQGPKLGAAAWDEVLPFSSMHEETDAE